MCAVYAYSIGVQPHTVSPSLVNEAEAIGSARNVERTPEAAARLDRALVIEP